MERKTFSLFLRIFSLSSVFFTEMLPPPRPKNAGKKKVLLIIPNIPDFQNQSMHDFFKIWTKNSISLPNLCRFSAFAFP